MIQLNLSSEQIDEIAEAIRVMANDGLTVNRMDYDWGSIYWAGTVLRLDIKATSVHA